MAYLKQKQIGRWFTWVKKEIHSGEILCMYCAYLRDRASFLNLSIGKPMWLTGLDLSGRDWQCQSCRSVLDYLLGEEWNECSSGIPDRTRCTYGVGNAAQWGVFELFNFFTTCNRCMHIFRGKYRQVFLYPLEGNPTPNLFDIVEWRSFFRLTQSNWKFQSILF